VQSTSLASAENPAAAAAAAFAFPTLVLYKEHIYKRKKEHKRKKKRERRTEKGKNTHKMSHAVCWRGNHLERWHAPGSSGSSGFCKLNR
jgi:hypothetical protein